MKNIIYILGSSLFSYFLFFSSVFAEPICQINGEIVPCPDWFTNNFWLIFIAGFITWAILMVFFVITFWKIFKKAGQKGWASIVPVYNAIIFLRISGFSGWYIFLMFVPILNIIFFIIATNNLSKSFGKGVGFTIGLVILPIVFFPILAFGESEYKPIIKAETVQ